MSADYPYVMTPDKFREFVHKLQISGKPPRVDLKYIKSQGYKSSNHEKFPKPLKFIGLIDGSGVPTDRFGALRDKADGKARIGSYIREAYADLYSVHNDAHQKNNEDLRNFFTAHTNLGEAAVSAMVATFKALCQFATFDETVPAEETTVSQPPAAKDAAPPSPRSVTINVNIQLSIPPTTDSEVYDKLFSSMAKHIKVLRGD
jgi:hypothetical protein